MKSTVVDESLSSYKPMYCSREYQASTRASRKVSIKYVGPLAVYKIVDLHNYLLITLDRKLLRGLFEHERLKPAVIRTNLGNVTNLSKLKQVMSSGLLVP